MDTNYILALADGFLCMSLKDLFKDTNIVALTGLLGAGTGILSVIFNYLQYKSQCKPDIVICNTHIQGPYIQTGSIKDISASELEELETSNLNLDLSITLKNNNLADGSILKPNLIIHTPKNEIIEVPPILLTPKNPHTILTDYYYLDSFIKIPGNNYITEKIKYIIPNENDRNLTIDFIKDPHQFGFEIKYKDFNDRSIKQKVGEIN